ncbi:MAG: peptide chain release factor N(5)-glutamine methyltransferase [Thermoguttaceae bacterium]|nr:peptide chain release factor N(5)-glutamine methyltransferase [Thermoguttaceae bacterium]
MPDQQDVWTVGRLLKWTADYFAQHGVDTPRLDAEILLAAAMGCERIGLYTRFMETASDEVRAKYRDFVKRRAAGEPTAYLIGEKEFYSLTFKVTPDTLIPRPETEHLIIETLDIIKKQELGELQESKNETAAEDQSSEDTVTDSETGETYIKFVPRANPLQDVKLEILDIGTGSGIIPITLAKQLPSCRFVAVDVSQPALEVAKQNAQLHSVNEQIEFRYSDLFSAIKPEEKFDFILSNPPYIGEEERESLDASVRDFEPATALFSGPKGTDLIEKMLVQAPDRLKPGGWLLFELSPIIHDQVLSILSKSPALTYIKTVKDFAGLNRVVVCRNNR